MGLTRIIISLPEETKTWLESYSKAHGISMAEAIRISLDYLRKEEASDTYRSLLEKTRGIWSRGDGLKYQKKIRNEWD